MLQQNNYFYGATGAILPFDVACTGSLKVIIEMKH